MFIITYVCTHAPQSIPCPPSIARSPKKGHTQKARPRTKKSPLRTCHKPTTQHILLQTKIPRSACAVKNLINQAQSVQHASKHNNTKVNQRCICKYIHFFVPSHKTVCQAIQALCHNHPPVLQPGQKCRQINRTGGYQIKA